MKLNTVIIGGGISGICTAYHLAENNVKNIAVIEKNYLGSGSTFRCATGIRASFTSEEHITLMKKSIELWKKLSEKHQFHYTRGGYLWLIKNKKQLEFFKKCIALQNSLGVPTRILEVEEIEKLVPRINKKDIIAAAYDPIAGKADPFEVIFKLAKACRQRGVKILTDTEAEKIIVKNGRVTGVETSKGLIETSTVIVAAGHETRKLLGKINIQIPLENTPHHILITERFREAFKPLVIDWTTSSYIVQTKEGNFIMGTEIEEKPNTKPTTRIDFIPKIIKTWTKHLSWLKAVRILRYWTGYYVTSPDKHPIYGPIEEVEGLYVAAGYSGHGFMMGPITGKIITEWILNGKPSIPQAEKLTLKRIRENKLIKEIAVIG